MITELILELSFHLHKKPKVERTLVLHLVSARINKSAKPREERRGEERAFVLVYHKYKAKATTFAAVWANDLKLCLSRTASSTWKRIGQLSTGLAHFLGKRGKNKGCNRAGSLSRLLDLKIEAIRHTIKKENKLVRSLLWGWPSFPQEILHVLICSHPTKIIYCMYASIIVR